jgi:hypothetical protein
LAGIMRNNKQLLLIDDEIRWKIIKALLEDFPQLRQRTEEYLKTEALETHRKGSK